jgi:probable F420-dependent oxidoreductase
LPDTTGGTVTAANPDLAFGFLAGGDLARASALEELPIDSLWTGGHIASRNPSTEALMSLARLSAVTERVRIGTSVLLLPLYPPAVVAKQIADLDRATGGRVILGVGVGGEYPQEFRACQVPREERGRRTDEAMSLIRKLWTAEAVTHEGRFYPMADVKVHPAPLQAGGPPIVVAGRKEAAMRRAALLGDGWMPYMYSPKRYEASVEVIRRHAAAAGRTLDQFGWYAWIFANVHPDGEQAREEAARMMGGNYNQDFKEMIDGVAAAGTVDEVLRKLNSFVDAGARHFIFLPATTPERSADVVDRLVGEVMPAVREHAATLGIAG